MRERLKVTGFVLWLLATVHFGDHSRSLVDLSHGIAGYEFRSLCSHPGEFSDPLCVYLTSPFTWKLEMPDFPSSHFQTIHAHSSLTQALFWSC